MLQVEGNGGLSLTLENLTMSRLAIVSL